MSDSAVEIRNLTRRFGSFTAVDGISLDVASGEIFGFLGANGAGKTTAIRMLCGLLVPTSGLGRVAGYDIMKESERIKRSIGYMSQKFSLYPDLTGRENMQFYGSAYQMSSTDINRRIGELIEQLDLGDFVDRLTGSIPVGWRQRVALANAILHEPSIIFLDEPTGSVDPVYRRSFWSLLYALAEAGRTIFVTTHYMDEAEFCERISIMDAGRIIALGRPADLKRDHEATTLEDLFVDLVDGKGPRA